MADLLWRSKLKAQWMTDKQDASLPADLRVIGAGLPRTGTTSMLQALNILNLGPVIHMAQNFEESERCAVWESAFNGKPPNWRAFLAGFKSTIDAPCCNFYEQFLHEFPDAKVVLTVRDSDDAWYKSYISTIGAVGTPFYRWQIKLIPTLRKQASLHQAIMRDWTSNFDSIGPQMHTQHNAKVRKIVPKERLLEFNVKQGWGPLCEFLDVPVPDVPFPHANDTNEIKRLIFMLRATGTAAWALLFGGLYIGLKLVLIYQDKMMRVEL